MMRSSRRDLLIDARERDYDASFYARSEEAPSLLPMSARMILYAAFIMRRYYFRCDMRVIRASREAQREIFHCERSDSMSDASHYFLCAERERARQRGMLARASY